MNDPTKTNEPTRPSDQDSIDAALDSNHFETPTLFGMESPAASDAPSEPGATEPPISPSKGNEGLEELATRLPEDHPPKWAMNWKPTGEQEHREIPGEHHPARTAGSKPPPLAVTNPEDHPTEANGSDQGVEADQVATIASPVEETGTRADPPIVDDRPSPASSPMDGPSDGSIPGTSPSRPGGGRLGWIAAAILALAWIGIEITTNDPAPPSGTEAGAEEGVSTSPPLARPAPDPERAIMLEEISILQDEVAVLRSELGAAQLLRGDHERITIELTRLERRWAVALDQLQFLEASLERERQERVDLATELDHAQRFLDETRGTD